MAFGTCKATVCAVSPRACSAERSARRRIKERRGFTMAPHRCCGQPFRARLRHAQVTDQTAAKAILGRVPYQGHAREACRHRRRRARRKDRRRARDRGISGARKPLRPADRSAAGLGRAQRWLKKPVLNATEKVLLIRALRMKSAARRATELVLSPMTGKGPKRYGIASRSAAMTASSRLRQIYQIRHNRAACSRDTGLVLLRTIGGALVQPIGQSVASAEFLEEACDMVAALPAARRTFDAQHIELAD
jgi:hypothetical protein